MEAVIVSTVCTQAALYALGQRSVRASQPAASPAGESAPPRTSNGATAIGASNGSDIPAPVASPQSMPSASKDVADEEVDITPLTIEGLEAEIAALRSQATYSADTLVAASRADRKANDLEAKLKALRAAQRQGSDLDVMATLQRFAFNAPGSAAGTSNPMTSKLQSVKHSSLVRFLSFLMLYIYFKWRGDRFVIRLPCDALRPLAWLLSTRITFGTASEGLCPASDVLGASCGYDSCGISYYMFTVLAGGFMQTLIIMGQSLMAKRK